MLQSPIAPLDATLLAGRYRVLEKIGEGGMGEVYRGRDEHLAREVAIKVLSAHHSADEASQHRLRAEARLLSRLNHPNIAQVYDFDSSQDIGFLVMEYVPGPTLADRLRNGALPQKELLFLAVQLAEGLAAAHSQGIIHRDLKPSNVVLTSENRLKILDFGLAVLLYRSGSMTTMSELAHGISGTLPYIAPEPFRDCPADERSDLYSLGVMLYEMATSRPPFVADLVPALVSEILNTPPPPPSQFQPELSPVMEGIILKCLEKEPSNRYQSAKEIAVDLRRFSRRTLGLGAASKQAARRAWRLGTGIALVMALVLVLSGRLQRHARSLVYAGQVSVAVLPFENVGQDSDLSYLQLALSDEVATALSYAPKLSIRPLAVTRKYLNVNPDPQAAGRDLRVQDIVTGHYHRQGDLLRVTIEAIQSGTGQLLCRETIEVGASRQLELRDRLAARLWQGVVPVLGGTPISAETSAGTPNPEAYDLYLHSISAPHEGAANREAIRMLERVVAADPNYALAWSALAERYHYDASYFGGGIPVAQDARAAAQRAVELDPSLISATTQLVVVESEAGHLDLAYDQALRALRRHPESGLAHFAASYVLRYSGLFEEAAKECDTALGLDPTNYLFRSCAITLEMIGQYNRAMDFARLDLGTNFSSWRAAYIALDTGDRSAALMALKSLPYTYVEAQLGVECLQHPGARSIKDLSARSEATAAFAAGDPENAYVDARMQAVCNQNVAALRVLRRVVEEGYCAYPIMDRDPLFARLRNTPEFGEIRKLGMDCRARFLQHRDAAAGQSRTQ